jgi:hypothetical protein
MKKYKTIGMIAAIALFSGAALAQVPDTVKIYNAPPDTVVKKEVQVIQQPTPVPAPAPDQNDDNRYVAPLRKTELGIRYYPTFSSLALRTYGGETVQGSLSMSNGWGVMIAHNFNRHVGFQVEVDYNQISQKFKDRNLDRRVDVSYLNIPVLLSLNTDKSNWVNWNFVAGPQFGINLGSHVKTNGSNNTDTLHAVVAVKPGDVGLAYGTGLEFMLNKPHTVRLDLGFRGFYGFVDMSASQSNGPDTYNIVVKASRKQYAGYLGITFLF